MLFSNYQIFFDILIFVLLFVAAKWIFKKGWLNNILIFLGNALILKTIVSPKSLFLLAIVAILCYGAGCLLYRKKHKLTLALSLIVLIAFFAIRNYPLVQHWLGSWWTGTLRKHFISVEKVGLSYILFRIIHWLVECYRQNVRTRNFLSYFNYLFFFPTFMAGPIDTLNNFHYWVQKTHVRFNVRLLFAGLGRIFMGAVKVLLIVPLMLPYATNYQTLMPNMSPWCAVVVAAVLYSFYIYIDFSGYSDMAIGMAYMLGIRTPENFNNPYFSRNISEFWKRWHITFSSFLSIYVFKPVIAFLNGFGIAKYRMLVSVIAYLVTFFVCGIWHGATANFVLWGLWHGVGLSICKIWSRYASPHISLHPNWLKQSLGILMTFVFVTIGWIFFNYPIEQLQTMFNLLFL